MRSTGTTSSWSVISPCADDGSYFFLTKHFYDPIIKQELSDHADVSTRHGLILVIDSKQDFQSLTTPEHGEANENRPLRMASEAQIRAIRALASKSRVSLTNELQDRFEVSVPNDSTLSQASQLIDSMKQDLTPTPA